MTIFEDKKFTLSDLSDEDKEYYISEYNKFVSRFFDYKMKFYLRQPTSNEKTFKELYNVAKDELMWG